MLGADEDGQGVAGALLRAAPWDLEGLDEDGEGVAGALLCAAPGIWRNLMRTVREQLATFFALPPGCVGP